MLGLESVVAPAAPVIAGSVYALDRSVFAPQRPPKIALHDDRVAERRGHERILPFGSSIDRLGVISVFFQHIRLLVRRLRGESTAG